MPSAPLDYEQLALQLRALAALARDEHAQAQLNELAARYERLAAHTVQLSDKYLAVTELPDVKPVASEPTQDT